MKDEVNAHVCVWVQQTHQVAKVEERVNPLEDKLGEDSCITTDDGHNQVVVVVVVVVVVQ